MNFILPFVISFGLSFILTPVVIFFAKKYNFVDDPKQRDHPAVLHKNAIPRAGGLPIFLAFAASALLLVPFSQKLLGIILGALVLVVVGVVDDKLDLKSLHKFAAQILAALVVVASGIGISFITNPFHWFGASEVVRLDTLRFVFDFFGTHSIVILADLFAIFWIVWVINMVNFSSGVDGQLPGIALVALLVIFAASLRFFPSDPSQLIISKLAIIGAGATLAFLFYNLNPAKIFPGDSGSYFLGFLIATLAIASGAKVGAAILVMAVPLVDGVFTVLRRIAQRRSPFLGDRGHLHHRLLAIGFSQVQVALFYWLLCAILGAIALLLPALEKLFAGAIVAIIILGGLLWLNMNLPQKAQK